MTSMAAGNENATAGMVDLRLDVVAIPVADVDRSKEPLRRARVAPRCRLSFDDGFWVIQYTPPGSGCSVQFGSRMTSTEPDSATGTNLIVSDIAAARDEPVARGAHVSEVFHAGTPGAQFHTDDTNGPATGPAP